MSATTEAVVLRQFAALRRHGLSAGEALEQLIAALPPGSVREATTHASLALRSPAPLGPSAFVRVLANPTGEAVHAESLADAIEAQLDAADSLRATAFLLQLAFAMPCVVLCVLGWVPLSDVFGGANLPLLTSWLVATVAVFKWVGVPLALLAVTLINRVRWSFAPGHKAFTRAQRLLEASTWSAQDVALARLDLPAPETLLLKAFQRRMTPDAAMRQVAVELSRDGHASLATFRVLAPMVAAFVSLQFFGAVIIAMYLPIFSLAGAIK